MKEDFDIPDEFALNEFFRIEREKVLALLHGHLSLSFLDSEDVYQEACIALYENIQNGKYKPREGVSLSTYFIQICINLGKKHLSRRKKDNSLDTMLDNGKTAGFDPEHLERILGLSDNAITDEQKNIMRDIVKDLPDKCEEILWSYYADEMSMEEIAAITGYNNGYTVKAKKSQCMSKLRERFNKIKSLFYGK